MTEFVSKITQTPALYSDNVEIVPSKPTYEITFSTNDRSYFDMVMETCRACIDDYAKVEETVTSKLSKDITVKANKTFGIAEAFSHLISGKNVRQKTWDKGKYIELNNDINDTVDNVIYLVNEKDEYYPSENLFGKLLVEGEWEDYEEE